MMTTEIVSWNIVQMLEINKKYYNQKSNGLWNKVSAKVSNHHKYFTEIQLVGKVYMFNYPTEKTNNQD
jgi:hypothetical protein